MAVSPTIYASQITWGGNTWSKSDTGGPLEVRYVHESTAIEDRTGDAEYSMATFIVDKVVRATVRLRDAIFSAALGAATSDLVITLTKASGTGTITLTNMKLMAVRPSQSRAQLSENELEFVHESADGTTNPVGVA